MGAIYTYPLTRVAASTSADRFTVVNPAGAAARVLGLQVNFEETAAALLQLGVYVSTGGVTGSAPITGGRHNPKFAASTAVVNTAWVTQPTLGELLRILTMNAVGSRDGGWFPASAIIDIPPSGQISMRSISGTSNFTGWLTLELL